MSYRDGNPPSSWYDPPEYDEPEDDKEELEPDELDLEDQYIEAIERDYDRYLNWLYK